MRINIDSVYAEAYQVLLFFQRPKRRVRSLLYGDDRTTTTSIMEWGNTCAARTRQYLWLL